MTTEREYFRVPCEFQIRFRKIDEEELRQFLTNAMRPAPSSILRMEVETQLSQLSFRDETKILLEKAFQLLLNMDQRLERIEETMEQAKALGSSPLTPYAWVHGDLGAGGLAFESEKAAVLKEQEILLTDLVLSSMPEFRFVAASRIVKIEGLRMNCEFVGIHADDREYIHRFVMARQREQLRSRSKDR